MKWFNAVEELGPGASSQVGSWYATCCMKETEGNQTTALGWDSTEQGLQVPDIEH